MSWTLEAARLEVQIIASLEIWQHIGSIAAEAPVKFQSDRTILNTNLAASTLCEILKQDVLSDTETEPGPRLNIRKDVLS